MAFAIDTVIICIAIIIILHTVAAFAAIQFIRNSYVGAVILIAMMRSSGVRCRRCCICTARIVGKHLLGSNFFQIGHGVLQFGHC